MKYISEQLDRKAYNRKFDKVVRTYATELDITDEEAAEILMDNDEVFEYVDDETMDAYDIVDKLLRENMRLTEAKQILKESGYLVESIDKELTDDDKLLYLYLTLKKDGQDVTGSTDYVMKNYEFKLKIKKPLTIEKLDMTFNIGSITIGERGCEIFASIIGGNKVSFIEAPLNFDREFTFDKLSRRIMDMDSFVNVEIHNAIYEYLKEN